MLKPISDRETLRMYQIGEEIDLPDDRANDGISRGLLAPLDKPEKKARKKKED